MRRRLAVPHLLKSASVAATVMACPLLAQAASVQTVFAVENALYGAGYSIGQADGWIDDKLHAAVRQYQADRPGLNATGELDSPTLAALGISDNRPQLMSGNLVASREAAKKELGLKMMASIPKAAPETASKAAPEPEPKPEPRVAKVSKTAAQPQPEKAPEPAPRAAPEPVEQPEPQQVAKAQPVALPEPTRKQAEPEPTSEPIKIVARERASEREEPNSLLAEATQAAPEETVNVVSVNDAVEKEAAAPQESTAAGLNPEAVNSEAASESQPPDSQGNVITKVFYFLFGWMV